MVMMMMNSVTSITKYDPMCTLLCGSQCIACSTLVRPKIVFPVWSQSEMTRSGEQWWCDG
jgi:hypothetical protein